MVGDAVWQSGQVVVMNHRDLAIGPSLCTTAQTNGGCGRRVTQVLILAALCIVTLTLVALVRRRLTSGEPDLGWVSERWLAEYRADSTRPSP